MHEDEAKVRGISQVEKYTIVAVILGIVTSMEVLVLYPPLMNTPDPFKVGLLGFLATLKFVVVVAFFMHLWNDSPLFTGIFGLGMLIGVGTLVALMALFSYYPKPPNAIKAPPVTEIYRQRYQEHSEGADEKHAFVPPALVSSQEA